MKLKYFFFFFAYIILTTACKKQVAFNEVKVNDKYSVLMPEYLSQGAKMHQQASLQYQNEEKEVYMLVIDESKEAMADYDLEYDIDNYFKNIVSKPFKENIKDGKISIPGRQTINGQKALVAEITGKINGNDVYYKLAVVESPSTFYQILIWTRAEKKPNYEKDMIKTIESFKELNNSLK